MEITTALTRNWLPHNPAPKYILADSALFVEYLGKSGVGLMISPPECHWLMGIEEQIIGRLKATVDRLRREAEDIPIQDLFRLAVHAHNSTIQASTGFSPFQWTRGVEADDLPPAGIDPRKAFEGVLKMRERAAVAYRRAQAADHMSKLNNASGRPSQSFERGSLVMLWREKRGSHRGGWRGPVRLIHQEGSTFWLASGASLIRAKANQMRRCSKVEEALAISQKKAVYKMPVTMETLLRRFRGKMYEDISGSQPPKEALQDTVQSELRAEHRTSGDSWKIENGWLIRIHVRKRLTLFTPGKMKQLPVPEERLTGERRTIIRYDENQPAKVIDDDYKRDPQPGRSMMERWSGETKFKIEASHPAAGLPESQGENEQPGDFHELPVQGDQGSSRKRRLSGHL